MHVHKVKDPNLLLGDHYAIDMAYTDGDHEVQSCIRRYPWLIQMVKSKLFHELCDKPGHTSRKRCYFCCDCMIPPFCDVCYKKSDHENHTTIQAFRCSNQSGVRKEEISKYMDLSGMHLYTINGKQIVYINQRRDTNNHCFRNNVSHKCKVCEWELDAASTSLFCSIQRKFKSALGSRLDELMRNSEISEERMRNSEISDELMRNSEISEDVMRNSEISEELMMNSEISDELMRNSEISGETEPVKKKRRSRKGIPHRAPFY